MKLTTKYIAIAFLCIIANIPVFGQKDQLLKLARKNIMHLEYDDAYKNYDVFLLYDSLHVEANFEFADLLATQFNDKIKAIKFYERAIKLNNKKDTLREVAYNLAECYQTNRSFDKAISIYNSLLKKTSEKKKAERDDLTEKIKQCEYEKTSTQPQMGIKLVNLGRKVNTKYPEYVPIALENNSNLIYNSRRKSEKNTVDINDNKYYEDIYFSEVNEYGLTYAIPIDKKFTKYRNITNSSQHDAVVSLTYDEKTIIICKSGKLYYSNLIDSVWSKPIAFDKNINCGFHQSHACLSADKKTIYFTSDVKGGFGGLDIYKSTQNADGTWSKAINLGPKINTKKNEDSPQLSFDDQTLYFASNGLEGFGGYDLFKIDLKKKEETPGNLGKPINSGGDDIFLRYDKNGIEGYFSSSRKGGMGDLDLYAIENYEVPTFEKGVLAQKNILKDQLIPKSNLKYTVDFEHKSDLFSMIPAEINAEKSYIQDLKILQYNWQIGDSVIVTKQPILEYIFEKSGNYDVILQIVASCDTCDNLIKYDVLKNIQVKDAPMELLAEKKIENGVINSSLSLKESKIGIKTIENKQRKYESYTLYYQLNRSKILPDQLEKLNIWINQLGKEQITKVEIDAHTDDSGSFQFNQKLSDKRAETLKNDLKKMLLELTSIQAIGKGELEPKIICGTSKPCSFKERNKNRRAEVKVYFNP